MRYEYLPNDPQHFATNLRQDFQSKNLIWDNARGKDVLIVQTTFGVSAVEKMEELCSVLENTLVNKEKFTEIATGVWLRIVTASEKAKQNGCPLNGEASTYTVFGVMEDSDNNICKIFAPQNQAMITACCDVPLDIHVEISQQTREEGFLFAKKTVTTGFYSISFIDQIGAGYVDGDLCCEINKFQVPLTRKMLENRVVYVKSTVKPQIVSLNKGMQLK